VLPQFTWKRRSIITFLLQVPKESGICSDTLCRQNTSRADVSVQKSQQTYNPVSLIDRRQKSSGGERRFLEIGGEEGLTRQTKLSVLLLINGVPGGDETSFPISL